MKGGNEYNIATIEYLINFEVLTSGMYIFMHYMSWKYPMQTYK